MARLIWSDSGDGPTVANKLIIALPPRRTLLYFPFTNTSTAPAVVSTFLYIPDDGAIIDI